MSIPVIGKMTIEGLSPTGAKLTWTTDPETYTIDWPRRQDIIEGLAGAVTKQDSGRVAKDLVLRLDSGNNQWLNLDFVKALEDYTARKGATFTFKDAEGNEYTVTIEDFTPYQAPGMQDLFRYKMEMHVFGITKRFGDTYGGD